MRLLSIVFLTVYSSLTFAQELSLDYELVESELIYQINELRKENQLKELQEDELLSQVCFEQAEYIQETGRLSHEQESSQKQTLLDRIVYFEGLYAEAGENILSFKVGSKQEMEPGKEKVEVNTEAQVAKASITAWLDDAASRLNLLDPNFGFIGSSVLDKEGELYIVVVSACWPYPNPGAKKLPFDNHGVNPYDKQACSKFLEEHNTLPQLFSDALKVEQDGIYFNFHSLGLFENIFADGNDGIAVEVISRDQFSCEYPNRYFPGQVADGLMLKPSKRLKLINANKLMEQKKVRVKIAETPDFFNENDFELNAIIIHDDYACETVPFNRLKTQDLKQINNRYLLAGDSINDVYKWSDSLTFQINLNQEDEKLEKEIQRVLDVLNALQFKAQELKITQQLSPLSQSTDYIAFQDELKASLGSKIPPDLAIEINDIIAWDAYDKWQDNTFYQIETEGMSREEVKSYLAKQKDTDTELKGFLNSLDQLQLQIKGEASFNLSTPTDSLISLYNFLVEQLRIEPAASLQKFLIGEVKRNALSSKRLPVIDPSQKKTTLPLISNQAVLAADTGAIRFDGNPYHLAFLEMYLIDPGNPFVSFNYHLAMLKHWADKPKEIRNPDKWEDAFQKLKSNSRIPQIPYARAMLNYFIIMADYHYEVKDFSARRKDFDGIIKWQAKAALSPQELLELAQYLSYQDQLNRALVVLKKQALAKDCEAEILFYYLQILPYDAESFSVKTYSSLMEKAQANFPEKFCQFFGKEVQGIQPLRYEKVKELYCKNCNAN